jgi:hypothetical protein
VFIARSSSGSDRTACAFATMFAAECLLSVMEGAFTGAFTDCRFRPRAGEW